MDSTYSSYQTASSGDFSGILIFALLLGIVMIVANWKLFTKAGKSGVASIIPIYNSYVLCDIVFGQGWLFLLSLVPLVGWIFVIVLSYQVAIVYGKSSGFALLSVFFYPITLLIIAFGKAEYIGTTADIKNGTAAPRAQVSESKEDIYQ